jgi:hypothetical protein
MKGKFMKKTAIFAIALCSASLYAQKPKTIEYEGSFKLEAPMEEPAVASMFMGCDGHGWPAIAPKAK